MMEQTKTPLRQRKKELIREAIMSNAERLFEARGYDAVTVAEIADAANISVKTLFTYFRSKEDLLFQDTWLIDTVLAALASRAKPLAPAQAVAEALSASLSGDVMASLDAFHRGYGDSEALRSRLLRLWAEYEDQIAQALATAPDLASSAADVRLLAAQLTLLVRSATWSEVRDLVRAEKSAKARSQALAGWFGAVAARIDPRPVAS